METSLRVAVTAPASSGQLPTRASSPMAELPAGPALPPTA